MLQGVCTVERSKGVRYVNTYYAVHSFLPTISVPIQHRAVLYCLLLLRKKYNREEEILRQETADLGIVNKEDFVPIQCVPNPHEKRLRLNVGGQVRRVHGDTMSLSRKAAARTLPSLTCNDWFTVGWR